MSVITGIRDMISTYIADTLTSYVDKLSGKISEEILLNIYCLRAICYYTQCENRTNPLCTPQQCSYNLITQTKHCSGERSHLKKFNKYLIPDLIVQSKTNLTDQDENNKLQDDKKKEEAEKKKDVAEKDKHTDEKENEVEENDFKEAISTNNESNDIDPLNITT